MLKCSRLLQGTKPVALKHHAALGEKFEKGDSPSPQGMVHARSAALESALSKGCTHDVSNKKTR